jgi:hypothetical protein
MRRPQWEGRWFERGGAGVGVCERAGGVGERAVYKDEGKVCVKSVGRRERNCGDSAGNCESQ